MMDVIIRQDQIDHIPVLEVHSTHPATHLPMVLLCHGYGSFKETLISQAYYLAQQGNFVVLPDAFGHGLNEVWEKGADFFQAIIRTGNSINRIIEHYRHDPRVDTNRVGAAGYSMGGCTLYHYLGGQDVRLRAVASMIGTPDFASIMRSSEGHDLAIGHGLAQNEEDMQQIIDEAERVQPSVESIVANRIPILIQHGEEDELVPLAPVRQFYEAVKPAYPDPGQIQIITYPRVGHAGTLGMIQQTATWFNKWLS